MGIPAICNQGVGDVAYLVAELDGGMVIDVSSEAELLGVVDAFPDLLAKKGKRLREAAQSRLSLELAGERYRQIYNDLMARC
jgi:glycosyltransferase involved in cell wall biosynthesis